MIRLIPTPYTRRASCPIGVLAALAAGFLISPAAQAQCPSNTACDPGPRPVGAQVATFAGPTNAAGAPLLPTPVVNTRQPADASGNEGAGRVITNGGSLAGKFWGDAGGVFGQLASVNGATDPASGNPTLLGLGPAFNGNSCAMCHAQPAIGGTSPGVGTPGFTQNPQITLASAFGASNPENLSTIITPNGPTREVRFILSETDPTRLTLDGGVHDLFTIQGRSDAPNGCTVSQPDITTQLANKNAIFRIPTPTFGLGLVENVADADLVANAAAEHRLNSSIQNAVLNRSGNDGTVARFGWKAQNKSLLLFSGEASNVEMGMTNELFPNERTPGTDCTGNPLPEDATHVFSSAQPGLNPQDTTSLVSSAIENFTTFMRLNGAPGQCDFASGVDSNGNALCNPLSASALAGLQVFNNVGCNVCHTQSFTTQPSSVEGLSNRTFQPFSDFGVHHMGATLADGVTQGLAGPDQFRTAPLWGVGQRLFFLHDGRTSDLKQAILDHSSSPALCVITASTQLFTVTFPLDGNATGAFFPGSGGTFCGSEANTVVTNFKNQSVTNQQNLLNFLRSL
jgi:Di-haem oxidoreductase, putative peroxidase